MPWNLLHAGTWGRAGVTRLADDAFDVAATATRTFVDAAPVATRFQQFAAGGADTAEAVLRVRQVTAELPRLATELPVAYADDIARLGDVNAAVGSAATAVRRATAASGLNNVAATVYDAVTFDGTPGADNVPSPTNVVSDVLGRLARLPALLP